MSTYSVNKRGCLSGVVEEPVISDIDDEDLSEYFERYINFMTDFAFKYFLGKPESKRLLHLINAILTNHFKVGEIDYIDTEIPGRTKKNRKSLIDILAKEVDGRVKIIVEMQARRQEFFVDRSVLYAGQLNAFLARKGFDWDYDTDPIVTICFVDFPIRKNHPGYVHFAKMMFEDVVDRKAEDAYLTNKQLFVYIELNKFDKGLDELETDLDKWLFLIKNLSSLTEMPAIFDNEIFRPIFEAAEYTKMSEENKMLYKSELDEQWRRNADIGGAKAEGREEGKAEGLKEGLKEGIVVGEIKGKAAGQAQEKRDVIRSLLVMSHLSLEQIAEIVKAPIGLVQEINIGAAKS